LRHWGLYVLGLICIAGAWEIYKGFRTWARDKKSAGSQHQYHDPHAEPLFHVTPKFTRKERWGYFVVLLMIFAGFYEVLSVLLTSDLYAMFAADPLRPAGTILYFFSCLFLITAGTFATGPFVLIKIMVMAAKTLLGTYLFFDRHMEVRAFLYPTKNYPYEIMEARVVRFSRNKFDSIAIRKALPGKTWSLEEAKKPSWNEDIIAIGRPWVTEEEFARVEQFLARRVNKFYRDELFSEGTERLEDKANKRRIRWYLFFILLIELVLVILFVWVM